MNPNVSKITGVICGYRVEEIEDPIMQKVRYLDKLIDELAKGRPDGKDFEEVIITMMSKAIYYHCTKTDFNIGELITPGFNSNYGKQKKALYAYLTATLDAATWGAELAQGDGPGRIYIVEPTGPIEDDPNLTDKKFPGNPTKSYRTKVGLRVIGEVKEWQGHPTEQLQAMKDHLVRLKEQGIEAIED